MPITEAKRWKDYVDKNSDSYGGACVYVARKVMEFLDENEVPIDKDNVSGLISKADDAAETGGLTMFMAGCVAQMVIGCHSRGAEFRKAWNACYGVEDENEKGVVNPAILTIGE